MVIWKYTVLCVIHRNCTMSFYKTLIMYAKYANGAWWNWFIIALLDSTIQISSSGSNWKVGQHEKLIYKIVQVFTNYVFMACIWFYYFDFFDYITRSVAAMNSSNCLKARTDKWNVSAQGHRKNFLSSKQVYMVTSHAIHVDMGSNARQHKQADSELHYAGCYYTSILDSRP